MTFLTPALLALGAAIAVPLILHLLQRHQGPRMIFPALRYLRRAEREHATRIRLRQVLLLALRVLALLLLAAAAARPFLHAGGTGHHPTNVVIVLDNSLSTGAVIGERRVLDRLADAALAALELASPDDRFWLIRAGTPWEPAITGDAVTVAEAVRRTEPSGGAADLSAEVERAASILATEAGERAREIHVLSDLQATSLRRLPAPDSGAPSVVILTDDVDPPANRAITDVELGGGLPPRAGERSTVVATVGAGLEDDAEAPAATSDSVTARLVLDGSVRAAAAVAPGAAAVLTFPARAEGLVTGWVEIDADALHADDRRHFTAEVTASPLVALTESQPFLDEALSVLEDAGRLRRTDPARADVVIAPGALGADAVRRGAGVVVLAPATPLELAAANQRLAATDIPWRFAPPRGGEARIAAREGELADVLAEARLREVYGLERQGAADDSVLLRLTGGEPWAVAGSLPVGRYVVVATPFTPEGGSIPLSAAMLPLLDRAIGAWAQGSAERADYRPGDVVTLPPGDSIVRPDGPADPATGGVYRLTDSGIYTVVAGGRTIAAYAVNPPPEESDLRRAEPRTLAGFFPGRDVRVAGPDDWGDAVYQRRLGREIAWPLVLLALALLILESALAATGRTSARIGESQGAWREAPRATPTSPASPTSA